MFLYVIPIIVSFLIISMVVFKQFLTVPLLLLTLSAIFMYSEGAISRKIRYVAILINIIVILMVLRTIITINKPYKVYGISINGIRLNRINTIQSTIPFQITSVCVETNGNNPLVVLNYGNYSYYVFGFSCSSGICCTDTNIIVPPSINKLNIISDSFESTLVIHYDIVNKKYYEDFLKGKNDGSEYYQFLVKTNTIAYESATQSKYKYILYMYFPFVIILVSVLVLILSLFSFKKI